ncbi:MAG: hypothetical protein N4A62_20550 [Marinisporobacter sp.]|nr:hypothetical protein [Marinisporobacter sp.]
MTLKVSRDISIIKKTPILSFEGKIVNSLPIKKTSEISDNIGNTTLFVESIIDTHNNIIDDFWTYFTLIYDLENEAYEGDFDSYKSPIYHNTSNIFQINLFNKLYLSLDAIDLSILKKHSFVMDREQSFIQDQEYLLSKIKKSQLDKTKAFNKNLQKLILKQNILDSKNYKNLRNTKNHYINHSQLMKELYSNDNDYNYVYNNQALNQIIHKPESQISKNIILKQTYFYKSLYKNLEVANKDIAYISYIMNIKNKRSAILNGNEHIEYLNNESINHLVSRNGIISQNNILDQMHFYKSLYKNFEGFNHAIAYISYSTNIKNRENATLNINENIKYLNKEVFKYLLDYKNNDSYRWIQKKYLSNNFMKTNENIEENSYEKNTIKNSYSIKNKILNDYIENIYRLNYRLKKHLAFKTNKFKRIEENSKNVFLDNIETFYESDESALKQLLLDNSWMNVLLNDSFYINENVKNRIETNSLKNEFIPAKGIELFYGTINQDTKIDPVSFKGKYLQSSSLNQRYFYKYSTKGFEEFHYDLAYINYITNIKNKGNAALNINENAEYLNKEGLNYLLDYKNNDFYRWIQKKYLSNKFIKTNENSKNNFHEKHTIENSYSIKNKIFNDYIENIYRLKYRLKKHFIFKTNKFKKVEESPKNVFLDNIENLYESDESDFNQVLLDNRLMNVLLNDSFYINENVKNRMEINSFKNEFIPAKGIELFYEIINQDTKIDPVSFEGKYLQNPNLNQRYFHKYSPKNFEEFHYDLAYISYITNIKNKGNADLNINENVEYLNKEVFKYLLDYKNNDFYRWIQKTYLSNKLIKANENIKNDFYEKNTIKSSYSIKNKILKDYIENIYRLNNHLKKFFTFKIDKFKRIEESSKNTFLDNTRIFNKGDELFLKKALLDNSLTYILLNDSSYINKTINNRMKMNSFKDTLMLPKGGELFYEMINQGTEIEGVSFKGKYLQNYILNRRPFHEGNYKDFEGLNYDVAYISYITSMKNKGNAVLNINENIENSNKEVFNYLLDYKNNDFYRWIHKKYLSNKLIQANEHIENNFYEKNTIKNRYSIKNKLLKDYIENIYRLNHHLKKPFTFKINKFKRIEDSSKNTFIDNKKVFYGDESFLKQTLLDNNWTHILLKDASYINKNIKNGMNIDSFKDALMIPKGVELFYEIINQGTKIDAVSFNGKSLQNRILKQRSFYKGIYKNFEGFDYNIAYISYITSIKNKGNAVLNINENIEHLNKEVLNYLLDYKNNDFYRWIRKKYLNNKLTKANEHIENNFYEKNTIKNSYSIKNKLLKDYIENIYRLNHYLKKPFTFKINKFKRIEDSSKNIFIDNKKVFYGDESFLKQTLLDNNLTHILLKDASYINKNIKNGMNIDSFKNELMIPKGVELFYEIINQGTKIDALSFNEKSLQNRILKQKSFYKGIYKNFEGFDYDIAYISYITNIKNRGNVPLNINENIEHFNKEVLNYLLNYKNNDFYRWIQKKYLSNKLIKTNEHIKNDFYQKNIIKKSYSIKDQLFNKYIENTKMIYHDQKYKKSKTTNPYIYDRKNNIEDRLLDYYLENNYLVQKYLNYIDNSKINMDAFLTKKNKKEYINKYTKNLSIFKNIEDRNKFRYSIFKNSRSIRELTLFKETKTTEHMLQNRMISHIESIISSKLIKVNEKTIKLKDMNNKKKINEEIPSLVDTKQLKSKKEQESFNNQLDRYSGLNLTYENKEKKKKKEDHIITYTNEPPEEVNEAVVKTNIITKDVLEASNKSEVTKPLLNELLNSSNMNILVDQVYKQLEKKLKFERRRYGL